MTKTLFFGSLSAELKADGSVLLRDVSLCQTQMVPAETWETVSLARDEMLARQGRQGEWDQPFEYALLCLWNNGTQDVTTLAHRLRSDRRTVAACISALRRSGAISEHG